MENKTKNTTRVWGKFSKEGLGSGGILEEGETVLRRKDPTGTFNGAHALVDQPFMFPNFPIFEVEIVKKIHQVFF